ERIALGVIDRMDRLEGMIVRYEKSEHHPDIVKQLTSLRDSLQALLREMGVKTFRVKPETRVDSHLYQRIKVVAKDIVTEDEQENIARIKETIRDGYIYECHGKDPIILRKAEVRTETNRKAV
ncbi:MAG: hypothetical protein AAF514_13460, partial [Verrucomicrobiota bacterium]